MTTIPRVIRMTVNRDRRNFLARDFFKIVRNFLEEIPGTGFNTSSSKNDYFDSFENCYPLLSEAGEMLMEEAAKRGLEIEGKSELEIARELFRSAKQGIV